DLANGAITGSANTTVQPVTFTVTNTNDSGAGSLRQAISDANNLPGINLIAFNIPGTGPFPIQPASALPAITDPVIFDATTQPGFAGTPAIVLDGVAAGNVSGLTIGAGGSGTTIRGVVIDDFKIDGILLLAGSNVIAGNYIGL